MALTAQQSRGFGARLSKLEATQLGDGAVAPDVERVSIGGDAELAVDLPVEVKGDAVVGDAVGDAVALPVGVDGDMLTADSSASEGVVWAP